jgi:hypothetical protein
MRTHHSAASMLAFLLGAVCIGLVLIWLIAVLLAMMARADERPADPTTGIVPKPVRTLKYKRIAPREEAERAFKPEAAAEKPRKRKRRRGR